MKNAIITGASSGIGAQISRKLASDGFQLSLLGRNQSRLAEVAKSCDNNSNYFDFDIRNAEKIQEFCKNWQKNNSEPLNALILNAGNIKRNSFKETTLEEWQQQFNMSVLGPISMIQALWDRITKDKTTIITISSTLAIKPIPETSAYSALKAAMINWTYSLAAELAPFGARVNCICPGIIETPIHGTINGDWHRNVNSLIPLGKAGQPQDIAEMVSYLVSEKAQWITGSLQVIDGGLLNLK
ncbi:MAG: SDR family oxidoreductase [Bdellovibrionaceae bacterium]|nr:SDR family oxidoreductase [Pseudobdellovibrionaceae bacterium]